MQLSKHTYLLLDIMNFLEAGELGVEPQQVLHPELLDQLATIVLILREHVVQHGAERARVLVEVDVLQPSGGLHEVVEHILSVVGLGEDHLLVVDDWEIPL